MNRTMSDIELDDDEVKVQLGDSFLTNSWSVTGVNDIEKDDRAGFLKISFEDGRYHMFDLSEVYAIFTGSSVNVVDE